MNLRIYAAVVTMALIAALTNPSEQDHYTKLESIYPWVNESLLTDAQMEVRQREAADAPCDETEHVSLHEWLQIPALSYQSYGLASVVFSDDGWVTCDVASTSPLLSVGLFGFVFLNNPPSSQAPASRMEPAASGKPTPPAYVIVSESEESRTTSGAASKFFVAYENFQKAEAMQHEGKSNEAKEAFGNVLKQLEEIQAEDPHWQPAVMSYRLKRTRDQLETLSKVEPREAAN